MPKTTIYLNDKTLQILKNFSKEYGKSISKISAEIIENNINSYYEQQKNSDDIRSKKISQHEINHYVTTTVALNLIFEAFKKLNNESSVYDGKKAEHIVEEAQKAAIKKLKEL